MQKLVRTGFGTNNVDHCTRLCHASSVAALMEGIGSAAVTAPFTACEDSDVVIVIGANPTENHPVAATYFKQAAKRGAELIVMDPRGQALRRHATRMLQFKPGADVALLNSLLNVIIEEGLYDRHYVAAHTEGFEELKRHVAEFPPEAMAEICGIDAETLRSVARLYARRPCRHHLLGHGHLAAHPRHRQRPLPHRPGPGHRTGRAAGHRAPPVARPEQRAGRFGRGPDPMFYPDYRSVEQADTRRRFEEVWNTALDPQRGLTVMEIVDGVHAGRIKGIYIMGENPAMSDPDVQHAREALARLDHLVVQEIFLTETAFHADVVLPASAWPEKNGTVTNSNRQVQMGRAALTPRPASARTGGSSRRSRGAWASTGATPARRTSSRR